MKFVTFFDPKSEIDFPRFFGPSLWLAAVIPIICLVGMLTLGFNWGIDFVGGTEMQVQFVKEVQSEEIRKVVEDLGFSKHQVQRYGTEQNNEMLIRVERLSAFSESDVARIQTLVGEHFGMQGKVKAAISTDMADRILVKMPVPTVANPADLDAAINEQQKQLASLFDGKSGFQLRRTKGVAAEKESVADSIFHGVPVDGGITYSLHFMGVSDKIAKALSEHFGQVEVRRVEFVDSQVSNQLRNDGALAVILALVFMLIYIAVRFNILFSPGAIVGLIQDTFAALMVFVFGRYEFDLPSVAAILTIVGVSINNTIIVYDRIRETLPSGGKTPLTEEEATAYVNRAVNSTLGRNINTALTVLFTTVTLWLLAGGVLKSFALALTVGIALGVFSSTFVAPATYLFMRRYFAHKETLSIASKKKGEFSREDRAKGVV